MRNLSGILIAACMTLAAGCASSKAPELPALYVEGTQLMAAGKPVAMRGVSFGWHNIWPRFYNK